MNSFSKNWNKAYWTLLIGLIIFTLVFGVPIIGLINTRSLIESIGCSMSFDYTPPCIVLGYDIRPRVGLYNIPFISALITPLLFVIVFREILILWGIITLLCRFKARGKTIKTFNVYHHPMNGFEAVKVGFSWPAFIFGILWMLYKKLWLFAGVLLTLFFLLSLIETMIDQTQDSGIQVAINLFLIIFYFVLWFLPAFKGNKWKENNLSNLDYELVGTMQTTNPDLAIINVQNELYKS